MANSDFRQRLNNAESEYNPKAWDQMNEMLNQLPEQDKRKKPFLFWLFGISTIVALIFSAIYFLNRDTKNSIEQLVSEVEQRKIGLHVEETSNVDLETSENSSEELLTNRKAETANTESSTQTDLVNAKVISKEQVNQDRDDLVSLDASQSKILNIENESHSVQNENNAPSNNSVVFQENGWEKFPKQILPGQNEKTIEGNQSNNITSLELESQGLTNIQNKKTELDLLSSIDRITDGVILTKESSEMNLPNLTPYIKPVDRSYRYYLAKLGLAKFNSNNGFHLGLGAMYELDQILAFQPEVAFSRGSDKSLLVNDMFEMEQQLDLSVLALVSLVQSENDKVCLEVGMGYTIYSGRRVINLTNPIDERSSKGTSYTVGLSYTRRMYSGDAIGLKLGAIAYDDAVTYLSLNYYKRF